jgi:hypothetical protein
MMRRRAGTTRPSPQTNTGLFSGVTAKPLSSSFFTPAPDLAAVSWKKATLAQGQYRFVEYTDLSAALASIRKGIFGGQAAEQLEQLVKRAIADDEAFLAAHPVRRARRKAEA